MAQLGKEIGKPLLVRSVRCVVLTPNKEALYHPAKFMLRQLDETILIGLEEDTKIRGRVTLELAPMLRRVSWSRRSCGAL